MSKETNARTRFLVVDEDQEVLDGIEKLLGKDGYAIDTAGSEARAVECAQRNPPRLVLLSLDQSRKEAVAMARRIRTEGQLNPRVPIVLFGAEWLAEGEEVSLEDNVFATQPDNFNQLRTFLARLLQS